jgi:hypothetical protein
MKIERYFRKQAVRLFNEAGFQSSLSGKKVMINTPVGVKSIKLSDAESMMDIVKRFTALFKPKESIYEEPPDVVAMNKSGQFPEEKLPEGYAKYILPNTFKPNIANVKKWVKSKKFAGMTNNDLVNEYNNNFGRTIETLLTPKQKEELIDSTAYKISRKIWYVGRRPADMTDKQWHDMTKSMRPREGSYSSNEKWNKFPYTESYPYRSGS